MSKQRVHDGLCGVVAQQMRDKNYDLVLKNRCYEDKPLNLFGEVDVLVKNGKYILLFECKCHDDYHMEKKATAQLERAKRYYNVYYPEHRIFKLMVFWKDHTPEYRWIK